jgi:cell shape-determining protein MreD
VSLLLPIGLGVLLIVAVSTGARALNAGTFVPDPVVIMVVHATLTRDVATGLWTAITLGYIAGTLTAGPRAPLLIGLVLVVAATTWMRGRFPMQSATAAASWVVVAFIVLYAAEAASALLFIENMRIGTGLWTNVPAEALLSAFVAWPLYAILYRVEPLLRAKQERGVLPR